MTLLLAAGIAGQRDLSQWPADPFAAAKVDEWLFWEQYSHETSIAVVRFRRHFLGQSADEIDPVLIDKGLSEAMKELHTRAE